MRYTDLIETPRAQGMLAVKAALNRRVYARDAEAIDQWGIMDDLWITPTGGLVVYRSLRVKEPWEKNLRLNGHIYWSTSRSGAAAYDADALDLKGTVDVTIMAEIPGNADVDWEDIWQTILYLHHQGEDEVRLDHGVPLVIGQIDLDGKIIRSRLVGKKITA